MKMKMKTRIFIVLALTFVLMLISSAVIFNTLGERYIQGQAQQDLDEASRLLEHLMFERFQTPFAPDDSILSEPLKLIRNLVRNRFLFSDDNVFIMNNDGFVFTMAEDNTVELQIANLLLQNTALLQMQDPFAVVNGSETFYAVLKEISNDNGYQWYAVIYVDTSLLHELLRNQSNFLVMSLAAAGVLVIFFAYLLISWITKPINDLKRFARRIGEGDFTPDNTRIDDTDLAELRTEMNSMAARLAANQEEQKRFFQNISHDLRTPLMSIQGYAEGIQYGVFEDARQPAEVILEESHRMCGMVDNLVYLSYMESADIKPNVLVDIRENLSRSIEKMQGVAMHDDKELICRFDDEELLVLLDEASIARAWQNLLSNALRYCAQKVIITCSKSDGIYARVSIADDGEGFAETDLEHIFQRFYKGKRGNYGLGLSISKEAIEKHSGKITARNSEETGGAEIIVYLPLRKAE